MRTNASVCMQVDQRQRERERERVSAGVSVRAHVHVHAHCTSGKCVYETLFENSPREPQLYI